MDSEVFFVRNMDQWVALVNKQRPSVSTTVREVIKYLSDFYVLRKTEAPWR
jgi:hypothetical protein